MQGLVIVLIVVLALLVIISVVLVVMTMSLSRRINRAQQNIKNINGHIDEVSAITSIGASIYGLVKSNLRAVKPNKRTGSKKADNK